MPQGLGGTAATADERMSDRPTQPSPQVDGDAETSPSTNTHSSRPQFMAGSLATGRGERRRTRSCSAHATRHANLTLVHGSPSHRVGVSLPKEACLRRAVLIMLLLSVVSACGVHAKIGPPGQAGQSGPPFELLVIFRPDTGAALATKVLSGCSAGAEVISVGRPVEVRGALRATVYTKDFERSARTQPLLDCLHASGSVQLAGWPD